MSKLIRAIGIASLAAGVVLTWGAVPEAPEVLRVTSILLGTLLGCAGCGLIGWSVLLEDNQ